MSLVRFRPEAPFTETCLGSADLAHLVERDLAKVEVAGSSPVIRSINKREEMQISSFLFGSIAQLGEHLPYKQRVIGSSPIVSTSAEPARAKLVCSTTWLCERHTMECLAGSEKDHLQWQMSSI